MAEDKIEVTEKLLEEVEAAARGEFGDYINAATALALVAEVRRLQAENARLTHVLGIQNAALLAYVQKYQPDALPGDDIAEVVTRDAEQLRAENAALKKALATYVMTGAFTFAAPAETAPQDAPQAWAPRDNQDVAVIDVKHPMFGRIGTVVNWKDAWGWVDFDYWLDDAVSGNVYQLRIDQIEPAETAPQDAPQAAWIPREQSYIRVTETGEKGIIFRVFFAPRLGRTLYRVEHTNGEYSDYERDEIERDE